MNSLLGACNCNHTKEGGGGGITGQAYFLRDSPAKFYCLKPGQPASQWRPVTVRQLVRFNGSKRYTEHLLLSDRVLFQRLWLFQDSFFSILLYCSVRPAGGQDQQLRNCLLLLRCRDGPQRCVSGSGATRKERITLQEQDSTTTRRHGPQERGHPGTD